MQFKYAPEGAKERSWPFRPGKLMSPEAEAIEKVTGLTFIQWQQAVMDGSMRATRALLWVLLKREEPTLKFDQVELAMDDVDWILEDEEKRSALTELQKRVDAGADLDLDEQQLYDELTTELGDPAAPVEDEPTEGGDPKAD